MYFCLDSPETTINKSYNSFCTDECLKVALDGRLQCKCGEDTPPVFDWTWQDQLATNIKVSNEGKEVLFHPVYSSGTAAVRGQVPFRQNYHYFWEIKIISKLYGTDVMIGVGTSKVVLEDCELNFCSLLGIDCNSWGYSYNGNIQHNKLKRKYGTPFGLGSIIGVHLDMCNGTLEYFFNRKSLGIAFRDLKDKELYPMVSSTAAQSSMRITCSISKEASLQMMCLSRIVDHPGLYREYRNIPGMCRIYDKQLFWIKPKTYRGADKKRMADLDEELLYLVDGNYIVKNKKHRAKRMIALFNEQNLQDMVAEIDNSILCIYEDLDLEAANKKSEEKTDAPSTSGSSSSTDKAEVSKTLPNCLLCLSQTHESKDCIVKSLANSDTDSDADSDSELLADSADTDTSGLLL